MGCISEMAMDILSFCAPVRPFSEMQTDDEKVAVYDWFSFVWLCTSETQLICPAILTFDVL